MGTLKARLKVRRPEARPLVRERKEYKPYDVSVRYKTPGGLYRTKTLRGFAANPQEASAKARAAVAGAIRVTQIVLLGRFTSARPTSFKDE